MGPKTMTQPNCGWVAEFRVSSLEFRDSGLKFRVSDLKFRVSGLESGGEGQLTQCTGS